MKLSDLPPKYRKQVADKLANGGVRAPLSSLSALFGKRGGQSAAVANARAGVARPKGTEALKRGGKKKVRHSMPPECGIAVERITCMETYGHFTLMLKVNPRRIPTAQQKGCDPRTGRFFRKPHILAWEKCITEAIRPFSAAAGLVLKPYDLKRGFAVRVDFMYPYPSDFKKSERTEGHPMTKTPDLDNAYKMIGDCLTRAGIIPDDAPIYSLKLFKGYTLREPRIIIEVIRNYR